MEVDKGGEESGRAPGGWAAAATIFFSHSARKQNRFAARIIRLMSIPSTEALTQPSAKCGGAQLWAWRIVFGGLVAGLLAACCVAQEPAKDNASADGKAPPKSVPGEPIQYVGPDTYILLDSQGRPQLMPGMKYEDFMAAWKKAQPASPHDRRPRFVLDNVAIQGKSAEDHATLQFEATVRLLSDETVGVPLGLVGTILQGKARIGAAASATDRTKNGDGDVRDGNKPEEYLEFDPDRGGYVVHLSGRSGEQRTVSLDLVAPLTRDGPEVSLTLSCPRALSAKLALDVSGRISDANVSTGALLSRETLGGGTRLSATGLSGPFRMTWNTAEIAAAELSTVLSASGAIQVSVDGRSMRTDARLTVRSYGGGFDRFRVRLPPGATLLQGRANANEKEPAYRVSVDNESGRGEAGPAASEGQIVLVELPAKQQGPVTVELSTDQPLGLSNSDTAVTLAGFEVLGAVRQFGDVALRVSDNWQARWDAGEHVRQVDTSELDPTLQQPGLAGAFQYDRQPWSLPVGVSAREIRVQATPEYKLEVLADEARLRARFTYQVLGARAHELRVDLRGWERTSDPIESGGVIDRDRVVIEDGVLVLPLAQTSLRRAELTFFVRRSLPRDAQQLNLPLPAPMAETVATGDLVVRTASGIELVLDAVRTTGLSPTPVTSDTELPADGGNEYRFRCYQPDAVFAADRISRSRDVAVGGAANISLVREQAEVRQRLEYTVRFEPMTELIFDLPGELQIVDGAVELALLSPGIATNGEGDETPLPLITEPVSGESLPSNAEQQVRAALPRPRLGRFAVELRFHAERPQDSTAPEAWIVPLARPADSRVTQWGATVRTPRGSRVALVTSDESSTWEEIESSPAAGTSSRDTEFTATRAESKLPMTVGSRGLNSPSATLVERAWLQTWLTGGMRQDRVAFRFRTAGYSVSVELPPDTAASDVEVLLDGAPADTALREAGRISVPLVSSGEDRSGKSEQVDTMRPHTLELRYRRVSGDRVLTRRRLTPPQLVGMQSLTDVYWQIVLPADRHVIQSPSQLAAASEWQWLGSFWGRRPTRSQAELEQWVGATTQQAPTAAQNEYLYSGLAPVASIEVITAPRWFIVLVSSGLVLAVAVAWIYIPAVRRWWLAVALACALAVLAVAYPAPAMLIAQASVLGIILAMGAALIARLVTRPSQWYLPPSGGSTHRLYAPRADSVVIGPMASAVASTAPTAALPVAEAEP